MSSAPLLPDSSSVARNAPTYAAVFGLVILAFVAGNLTHGTGGGESSSKNDALRSATLPPSKAKSEFDAVNARLIGPPPANGKSDGDCPAACGCVETPADCPRWYEYSDVLLSSSLADSHPELDNWSKKAVSDKAKQAAAACQGGNILNTGGWCLELDARPERAKVRGVITYPGGSHAVPNFHAQPSERIVSELRDMIQAENIRSVNDFGAGVGQYKAAMLEHFPSMTWKSYDGAGNVVDWTKGFVEYFDLTLPLALPKADWVLSLEVGEHIPSRLEGMMIRNLHHHNCRGVILSWGVFGQGGHGHVNIHSNEYIIDVFDKLGYVYDVDQAAKFRTLDPTHHWFEKSVMVFRRRQPVC